MLILRSLILALAVSATVGCGIALTLATADPASAQSCTTQSRREC